MSLKKTEPYSTLFRRPEDAIVLRNKTIGDTIFLTTGNRLEIVESHDLDPSYDPAFNIVAIDEKKDIYMVEKLVIESYHYAYCVRLYESLNHNHTRIFTPYHHGVRPFDICRESVVFKNLIPIVEGLLYSAQKENGQDCYVYKIDYLEHLQIVIPMSCIK